MSDNPIAGIAIAMAIGVAMWAIIIAAARWAF